MTAEPERSQPTGLLAGAAEAQQHTVRRDQLYRSSQRIPTDCLQHEIDLALDKLDACDDLRGPGAFSRRVKLASG